MVLPQRLHFGGGALSESDCAMPTSVPNSTQAVCVVADIREASPWELLADGPRGLAISRIRRAAGSGAEWRTARYSRGGLVFLLRAASDDPARIIGQRPLQRLGLIPRRAHPDVALLVCHQDDRHGLRMDRLDDGVRDRRLLAQSNR
jgi:hypothetical protein